MAKKLKSRRKEYVSVGVPKSLMQEVDAAIKNSTLGYSSRAEFLKEAIREKLMKVGV